MNKRELTLYICNNKIKDGSRVTKTIVCQDGFSMSVQGGQYYYSTPRADNPYPYYEAVEVGYPSEAEVSLMPHIEQNTDDPTGTVYPYVPVDIVLELIEKHGGIKE